MTSVLLLTFSALLAAQQLSSAPVVGVAEIDAAIKKAQAENIVDQLVKDTYVDGHRVGVAVLRRVKPETNALVHTHVTEVYQILSGTGTLTTGGTIANKQPTDLTRVAAGPSESGVPTGGESRKVGPRDVIFVPAGMPHRFSELTGEIVYLTYRFDSRATTK